MKKFILLFALFPFLHATSYPVEYISCKPEEMIVRYEDENIQISLFNTKIKKEEGWNKACSLIKKAKKLRIEIDPSSKIEETLIPVYLFADEKMVQEELIQSDDAYPMIHNPEYTYEKRLEDAVKTTAVMAKPVVEESEHGHALVAPLYLLVVSCLWLLMFAYMLWKQKRKNKKISVK